MHLITGKIAILAGLWLLLTTSLPILAATPVTEQVLAENLKLYTSISTLEVSFKQIKTLSDMEVQLKSEGNLRLKRPDQVTLEITKPSFVLITLNKNEIRIQSNKGAGAQTQVLKMGEGGNDQATKSLSGLTAWLNLDSKALAEQYTIYSGGSHSFRFEPKDKKTSPFENLAMTLGTDGQLKHLTIHEISGDTIDFEFGKPKITRK